LQRLWFRLLHVEAAVLADAPEMDGDEENGRQRQHDAVQHIEAQQRIGVHLVAAQQQEVNLAADQRNSRGQIGADGDGPERKLIPGQQIAGVAEQQRDDKEHNADDPVEFARCAIRAAIEDLEHVREDQEDHHCADQRCRFLRKSPDETTNCRSFMSA
jgi:hypothetical protein